MAETETKDHSDTAVVDTANKTTDDAKQEQNTDKGEERYKNLQAAYTKATQELAELKKNVEIITPYVDWEAASGRKTVTDNTVIDDSPAGKKVDVLEKKLETRLLEIEFRTEHPDMKDYENIVAAFIPKTDSRKDIRTRLNEAVDLTKKLIESEREKGKELARKKVDDEQAKEASTSGLDSKKTTPKTPDEIDTSYDGWLKTRQQKLSKQQGLI